MTGVQTCALPIFFYFYNGSLIVLLLLILAIAIALGVVEIIELVYLSRSAKLYE